MLQQIEVALRVSLTSVIVKLVVFLPALLALVVAVAIFTGIGALLAFAVRRILTSAKFDARFANNQNATVADWAPAHSPTELFARAALWACLILGVIVGISAFDTIAGSADISLLLIPYVTHAVGAVLILIVGTIIARFLARSILIGGVNAQLQYARFLSLGVKWLVLVLTAAMALEHLQIGGAIVPLAFGILFGGIVLTLSLAIGLGSRDLVGRSIERSVEGANPPASTARVQSFDDAPAPSAQRPTGTLRHF